MRRTVRVGARVGLALYCLLGSHLVAATSAQNPDPGERGPRAVTREEYTFGDTAFMVAGFPGPIEVTADVHSPTDLSNGPFPLAVFLHGRHNTCFLGLSSFLEWPCSGIRQPIPSYVGYDYLGEVLASHGYIVVSISANGINARDNQVFDLGMNARARLVQHHLDLWNTLNTKGGDPFGTRFVGKVDMNNIGTMGHSRGGEGVVQNFVYNLQQPEPYGIQAVLPLAPVNFFRRDVNNAALAVVLPYCDGDVSDLQGVHYYDDTRYNVPGDPAPKHTIYVMGGNHAFYNTIWTPAIFPPGSFDDWLIFVPGGSSDPHCGPNVPGNGRLTAVQQRGTGLAYVNGFFRLYLGGETNFFPYFQGDVPPPPSAMTDQIHVSYHPADDASVRRDVNRLLNATHLTTNHLGGAVEQAGFTPYDLCGGPTPQPLHCMPVQPTRRQPHTTPSARSSRRGLSQLRGGWDDMTATYRNDLPAGTGDVSGFYAFQFRAGVNFSDERNPAGEPQDFSVTLTDSAGNSSTTQVGASSRALFYPPGGPVVNPIPKAFLNTIRIPLSAFPGVNLTNIQSVQLSFDQTPSGALLLTDLMFADPAPAPARPPR